VKCEARLAEIERHAMEQTAILAGEREEFERSVADERSALATERAEFENAVAERQRRLAAVREELDQQRAEVERRLAELEAYRTDVEQLRAEVRAASAAAAAAASAASAASATPAPPPAKPAAPPVKRSEVRRQGKKLEKILTPDLAQPVVADSPPWRRPKWLVPAVATFIILVIIAVTTGIVHRRHAAAEAVAIGRSTIVPSAPTRPSGIIPRGGFLTQSASGALSSRFSGSPLVRPADSTAPAAPPAAPTPLGAAAPTPIDTTNPLAPKPESTSSASAARAAARERARQRAAAAAAARRAAPTIQPPQPSPMPEPVVRDTVTPPHHVDTIYRRDTVYRRDTTVRRDSTTHRPDTTAMRR
jgi:hypothetical protein